MCISGEVCFWTSTYPLVTGEGARKTRVNDYGGCCYLTSVTDEEGNAVHYGYDYKGTMTKQWTDIDGQSIETPLVEYDYGGAFGRLINVTTRKTSTDASVINYEYDDLGRVDKVNYYPQGMEITLGSEEYLYDEYGRLAAAKDGDGKITAYEYDYLDRVVKRDYNYPGTFTLPIAIPTSDPDGSVVSYTYDDSVVPTGRVATVTEVIDEQSVTSSYSYDDQGRLISYTPALPAGYGSITYTWGLQGQKTSMAVPMGNNSAKKYSYYYDREGRQVGMNVEVVACTSSPTLTAGSSGSNTRFFYDNSRNRVKLITKSGSAYYFVYDPTASIPAVVYEAVGNTAYLNVREPGGSLISREKYVSGVYQYSRTYHFDGLGSTIALTDEDGDTTDTYSYDAWGNVTPGVNNQTTDNPYQYVGKFGYYTHYQEPTLKLLQLGVRFYDSTTGRFTQIDPAKFGPNHYIYAIDNPIINVDPSGLWIVLDPSTPRGNWWQRQPKPVAHGWLGYWNFWTGVCGGAHCVKQRADSALALAQRHFTVGLHNGPGDAFRHCVWACMVMRDCGANAYNSGVIDHEVDGAWWAKGAWDPVESPMDLANDELGRKVAVSGQDCEEGCLNLAARQQLYVLPPSRWSP